MKKGKLLFGVLVIFMFLLSMNLVVAGPVEDIVSFVTGIIDVLKQSGRPVFELLFGQTETGGEGLVVQVLAFFLVMLVVYGVLGTTNIFGDKGWINLSIGAIVAVIGIRFLPAGFLQAAALPSSAFVGALVLGIPFILAFFIISKIDNPYARRAVWAGYAAIVVVLLLYNWKQTGWESWYWLYPAIIAACIVAFWFDGTLQRWLRGARIEREMVGVTNVELERALARLDDLKQRLGRATDERHRVQIMQAIKDQKEAIEDLRKQ